jgi:hypothetical protein
VTIVRAALDAGSMRLRVNVPTAATSPAVVRANLWMENEPVTCGTEEASPSSRAGVDVVRGSAGAVVSGPVGGVVGGIFGGVVDGVFGGVAGGALGGVVGGSVGIVGGVGPAADANVPVTGMISLPGTA